MVKSSACISMLVRCRAQQQNMSYLVVEVEEKVVKVQEEEEVEELVR